MSKKYDVAIFCRGSELAEIRKIEFFHGIGNVPRSLVSRIKRKWALRQRQMMEELTDEEACGLHRRTALVNLIAGGM